MRDFLAIEEKGGVREFIINDLSNVGLRIDTNKHRNATVGQTSPHIANNPKHQHGARVFNVPLHQMDTISIRVDDLDLSVPIFLRWCFDCIRRSIKHEGLFRKSGGSQRVKELMARIEDGSLTPSLSSSNTVFDICSLFKEFLRRLTYPLITHPLQDLLLDCFSMRSLPSERKVDIYFNILLLLPDEHLHALIYILRFLHEITLHERDNKMNAKNLAICVGPGIMRTSVDGKASLMTEQCATSVSDIVETLITNATKLGYVTDSIYERSQMLLEMRQKEAAQNPDDSFALENGMKHGIGGGKMNDPANAKKRRSGSVKEFLVHMTNRLRRRSGSNNDSRDQTNAFLDQSGKLSSSHTREHRHHYQHYQQNSIPGHCLSSSATSCTTTKRKSSDDPNGGNSKRGKTKTSSQEKTSLPNTNRFTSPITAFRRKKKTSSHSNDPGFPFKIEHSHIPQLLHFTDEVPVRFMNTIVNPTSSVSSGSVSSLSTTTPSGSMTTLTTSMMSNNFTAHGTLQPLSIIPLEPLPPLLPNLASISCNNKSLDAKKLSLLDSWKWPKSSRKAERKPLIAIHAPMLAASTINSSSLTELAPSPIKATNESMQLPTESIGGTSLLMHSSFGVRRHSDDVTNTSFTTTTFRPRRSISSSAGQQQTRHVVCMHNNYSHSLTDQQQDTSDDEQQTKNSHQDSFSDDEDEDHIDELNLAVVMGNEDGQSLKGFLTDLTSHENGALDVAFIDETDLERNLSNTKLVSINEPITTEVHLLTAENETLSQTVTAESHSMGAKENIQESTQSIASILVEKPLNKDENLDEILRRNENRSIRLTDSDDEDHENFHVKITSIKMTDDNTSATPTMPVRLSSSISNFISSSSSLTTLPSSVSKERSLSCSLSQPSNELFHTSATKWTSLNFGENIENISVLNSGRDSILGLKDELTGRVQKQVRAFEQQSSENIHNRSIVPPATPKTASQHDDNRNIFPVATVNTPEQRIIEEALTRGNKIVLSGTGTGEAARSIKRLQNTPMRRWKERAKEFEKRHQLTSPYRLLNKKKK